VLLEAIGLITGCEFLLGLAHDISGREYYGHVPFKTINGLSRAVLSGMKNYDYENLQIS
jgi:hypothetical protein